MSKDKRDSKVSGYIRQFYISRTRTSEERVRLTAFLLSSILSLITVPLHFIGLLGLKNVGMETVSLIFFLIILVALILYLTHKVSLKAAFGVSRVATQLLQSARMIIIAVAIPYASSGTMFGNIVVSYSILLYLTFGFMPRSSVIVTVLSLLTITFVAFYPPSAHLIGPQVWLLMVILEIFTCFFAVISQGAVHFLQKQTKEYKDVQSRVLQAFGVTKSELIAMLQMSRTIDNGDISEFFKHLNENSRRNIIEAAISEKDKAIAKREDMASVFPQLSVTELNVTRLIIEGKSKKEIAILLNKSDSNIGSVRINIRRKLGLVPGQDLREFVMNRMLAMEPDVKPKRSKA